MEILFVLLGGAFGSTTRFYISKQFINKHARIPLATFIINITGAFLLGLVSGLDLSTLTYDLIAEGFLGAYTTFSTFMFEDFILIKENRFVSAVFYMVTTLSLSLLFFGLGYSIFSSFSL